MERSEPTPVLPILSTNHAQLAAHVTLRRNKMMLPEYYNLKALGGSSTKLPPERRYRRNRDLPPKHSGDRIQNLPPKDDIITHAARNLKGSNQKTHRQAPPVELCPEPKGKTRLQPD